MRRIVVLAALAAAVTAVSIGTAPAQERVVNVYNWLDYVDPAVLKEFTAKTSIKLGYDTYDSNETLETKLLAGHSGYDVVVPTSNFLQREIRAVCSRSSTRASCPT
jgi:putrescine transport system substrate-binding protein